MDRITKNYEVQSVIVFSTGHMSEYDNDLLSGDQPERISCYTFDFGYFVWLDADIGKEAIMLDGFSEEFAAIYITARGMGARYVQFDSDGPIYGQHKVFEWSCEK